MFILDGRHYPVIPKDIILFYNSNSIPTNWAEYSSPYNNLIVGAGNNYNPGDSGGSYFISNIYSGSTGSGGAHNHIEYNLGGTGGGGQYAYIFNLTDTAIHTHSYGDLEYRPSINNLKLIKAQKDLFFIPANAVILGNKSFKGLTNILNNSFLGVDTNISSSSETSLLDLSLAGSHNHFNYDEQGYSTNGSWNLFGAGAGGHSDKINLIITESIKKVLLSAWTSSNDFNVKHGMIGLWESPKPPSGWEINTELQDCFIKLVTTGNENMILTGDNTIDIAAYNTTLTHSVSHTHYSGYEHRSDDDASVNTGGHTDLTWTHSHSISLSAKTNISYTPKYYALYFITKS